jgi:hypothetical protein
MNKRAGIDYPFLSRGLAELSRVRESGLPGFAKKLCENKKG